MDWTDELAFGVLGAMRVGVFGLGFAPVRHDRSKLPHRLTGREWAELVMTAVFTSGLTGLIATALPSSPNDSLIQNMTCALLVCFFAIASPVRTQ